ncbi:MAG: hypothetical protein MJ090_06030 [Clostridia bacterium]|nr:hypothetical protein [Clostridia bacterium]
MRTNKKSWLFLIFSFICLILFAAFPKIAVSSAEKGLLLCGNVIIPSLFPINFCAVLIMKIFSEFDFRSFFLKKAVIFILSMLGGYPTGAKLLEEEYKSGNISKKLCNTMLLYSVNGGVGFIISAVGYGIFGSVKIGCFFFLSQFLSSLFLALILNRFSKNEKPVIRKTRTQNPADVFVLSVSETANTVLSVCSYVLIFSVINGFLLKSKILRYLCFFTEITSALSLTKNIYLTAFLLSFGGISILCQILSNAKDLEINIKNLIISRIVCGLLSSGFMFVFLKVFCPSAEVFSNNIYFVSKAIVSKPSVTLSLLMMIILLIISLEGKKIGGNLKFDLLK